MTLNIDMERHQAVMDKRVELMRKTCLNYGDDILYPKRIFSSNHRWVI